MAEFSQPGCDRWRYADGREYPVYPSIIWKRNVPPHTIRLFRVQKQGEGIELANAVLNEQVKDSVIDLMGLP